MSEVVFADLDFRDRNGQIESARRRRPFVDDKSPQQRKSTYRIAACKCFIRLAVLAPRPGLEPGTYGLTGEFGPDERQ